MFIHNRDLEFGFPRKPCLGLGGKVGEVSHRRWSQQGLHGKGMANQVREQAVPRPARASRTEWGWDQAAWRELRFPGRILGQRNDEGLVFRCISRP